MKWQPIETAPKNSYGELWGPFVLGLKSSGAHKIIRWGRGPLGKPAWSDDYGEYVSLITHWMPLPEPPNEQDN